MQEEVTQKTIALYVKVGKGAARLTEQALQKAIQKFLEQKSKPAHGKQTMRQLMKQNAGVSNIEITDSNINAKHQGRKIPSSLTTTTGRGQNGRERSRTTKKAVNLFQDLLLSLAASVAAGIQFL